MKSYEELMGEFHSAYELAQPTCPTIAPLQRRLTTGALLLEEVAETLTALSNADLTAIADGLADVVFVAFHIAKEHGIPLDAIFREVCRSNMTKLGADGKPIRRADGKILKGPNYEPPRIAQILLEALDR